MQKDSLLQASARVVNEGSLEDCITEAEQLGAIVVKDKEEISEGCYAVLQEPQKNIIGIWQTK